MNREIKFRAWVTPNNDWFEKEGAHMISPEALKNMSNHKMTSFPGEWTWDCLTFMQYTGLKDKNGKEIYEGDFCTMFNQRPIIISFKKGAFGYMSSGNDYFISFAQNRWFEFNNRGRSIKIKVVGNIYENHELLKP